MKLSLKFLSDSFIDDYFYKESDISIKKRINFYMVRFFSYKFHIYEYFRKIEYTRLVDASLSCWRIPSK